MSSIANLEAEHGVLGAMLYDPSLADEVRWLEPTDFAEPLHGRLWGAMRDGARDPVSLGMALATDPGFVQLRGAQFLADLIDKAPARDIAVDHAGIVAELSARRRLVSLAEAAMSAAIRGDALAGVTEALADGLGSLRPRRRSRLRAVTAAELLRMELPPREDLLTPWLPKKGLAMVYAPRGVGKTHLSLGVAYAVASGGRFLKWRAPVPRRVLLVDGEMPAGVLRERLARLAEQSDAKPPADDFIRLVAADLHRDGIPDLASDEGLADLYPLLGDAELVVFDNLSTLFRTGKENEADSWGPVQELALKLRREGRSVLFIHHAGKSGAQRGTSRREDVLDTVINLKRPDDYRPAEGARFVITYEKARGFTGAEAEPFEAALDPVTGAWSTREIEDVRATRIVELTKDGLTGAEIARELGVNRSTVSRQQSRLRDEGRLS